MYDDIPKVVLPDPMPIDLKIAENFAEKNLELERYNKIMERKEDPDLKNGLGSLAYLLNRD